MQEAISRFGQVSKETASEGLDSPEALRAGRASVLSKYKRVAGDQVQGSRLYPNEEFGNSHSAVSYSRDVLKRPWPDLEPLLVGLMPALDLIRLKSADSIYSVRYARYHNGSETLKDEILTRGFPAAAFAYAAYGTRRQWSDAEPLILRGDTAARPALSTGVGDMLDINQWASPWESQGVAYARLFLKSGWPAIEDKMARGECHPRVAYEYADKVLNGPLPEAVETALNIQSHGDVGKDYISKYFKFAAVKRSQHSQGNISSSPTP